MALKNRNNHKRSSPKAAEHVVDDAKPAQNAAQPAADSGSVYQAINIAAALIVGLVTLVIFPWYSDIDKEIKDCREKLEAQYTEHTKLDTSTLKSLETDIISLADTRKQLAGLEVERASIRLENSANRLEARCDSITRSIRWYIELMDQNKFEPIQ